MTPAWRMIRGVAALAGVCFVALVVISMVYLRPEGLSNFDARVLGYDADAARAYLGVLSEQGRAVYLGPYRWLDTAFPLLASGAISVAIWLGASDYSVVRRFAMVGVVLGYLVMDFSENAYVAQMLRYEGPVPVALVDMASDMTQMKWALFAASLVFLDLLRRRNKRGSV